MKWGLRYPLYLLLLSLPLFCSSQPWIPTNNIDTITFKANKFAPVLHKKIGNITCDTCEANGIFNDAQLVSYYIVNAVENHSHTITNDFFIETRIGYPKNQAPRERAAPVVKRRIDHAITNGDFYFDFLAIDSRGDSINIKSLQYRVFHNGKLISMPTNISSLPQDGTAEIGFYIDPSEGKFAAYQTFKTTAFHLAIEDSLVIAITDVNNPITLTEIVVKRVAVFPLFEILQFSPGQSLQTILNKEIGQTGSRNDSMVADYEVQPGNMAVLRFSDFPELRKNMEYSFSSTPGRWQNLENMDGTTGFSMFSFIIINAPEPGTTEEIYLRYKAQRETIRTLKLITKQKTGTFFWSRLGMILVPLFLLFGVWIYFKRRKYQKQLSVISAKKEDIETRLQLLNGQLNPHFLFNSLNAVQSLINKNETEKANAYIANVAAFMRTIMDTGQKTFISLAEEIQLEENYIQLEQRRKIFSYLLQCEEKLDLSLVEFPPLLLQPVLENSIRHGMGNGVQDPLLKMEITSQEKNLVITVTDNGTGFDPTAEAGGHGLLLIKKRIVILNEKLNEMKIEMSIRSAPGKGTTTTFIFKNWL